MMEIHSARVRRLNGKQESRGPVVYWMNRDQRVHNNWALLYAQQRAIEHKVPLVVFFGLAPTFLGATARQYGFMLKGLKEVVTELHRHKVSFVIRAGFPQTEVVKFCEDIEAGIVVTDFSPLRMPREWRESAASALAVSLFEVDAHNIVPCWHASPKQEFAAATFRPKINRLLSEFLVEFPRLKAHPFEKPLLNEHSDFDALKKTLRVDESVDEVLWALPGEEAAKKALKTFIKSKLPSYAARRNDPTQDVQSNLSPYLHFGQLSAQQVALEVSRAQPPEIAGPFLEELIVRRELADNFCFYNPHYDSVDGFWDWAKKSLKDHENDEREYLYSLHDFEYAKTHDDLWNAAQTQMVQKGKMHGYMRMYWAKKILEWTPLPRIAMEIAIYLNDKYELDGRDPNGYCGIAWSIGGVHDRAWFDRPIFGKIRYMNYNGCKSKFSVADYISGVGSARNGDESKR